MASARPFSGAGEAAALVSGLLWACATLGFRRLKGRAGAGAMNLAKSATGTAGFAFVVLATTGVPWPVAMPLDAQAALAASGVVGFALCDTWYLRSILEVGPRRASLLMLAAPVLVLLGAALPPFSQTAPLSHPRTVAGALLALAGVAWAALEAPDAHPDPAAARRGTVDGLLAAVFQAAGVLLARWAYARGGEPIGVSEVRLASGLAALVVGGAALGHAGAWRRSLSHLPTLRALVVLGFFGTFLGIGLNQCGIAWTRHVGVVTVLNSLSPVWLIPLSTAFLGERHRLSAWVSTAAAVLGVALLA